MQETEIKAKNNLANTGENKDTHSIIILGNGFDVALGYPTKYSQFYENSDLLRDYAYKGNTLCKHILENVEGELWSDLERGLYQYSLRLTKEYGEGNKGQAEKFEKEFKELRKALFNYLDSVAGNSVEFDVQHPAIGLNIEWHELQPQYLTFNYSINTAVTADMNQRCILNANDSINERRFIYQHGSIYNSQEGKNHTPENIILGIDPDSQSVEPAHSFLYKNKQKLHDLSSTKNYIKEKNFYVVYGCSIGDSDATYFRAIFNHNQNNKIFLIYGYGSEAIENIKSNIERICKISIDDLCTNNYVEFFDVKNVTYTRAKTKKFVQDYLKIINTKKQESFR